MANEEADVVAHQQPAAERDNRDVWKWIAAVLAAVLLAGAPGYLTALLNRPSRSEFDRVEQRQQDVLQRLAVLEAEHGQGRVP